MKKNTVLNRIKMFMTEEIDIRGTFYGGMIHIMIVTELVANIIEPQHEISNILTSVDSDEPLLSPFKLRNSKWCSVSSLTIKEYSSD